MSKIFQSDYNGIIKNVTSKLPKKIDDEYVKNMSPNGGSGKDYTTPEYNWFLCGQKASKFDTSELSQEQFSNISFDTNTEFSKEQLEKFKPLELLENGKKFGLNLQRLHDAGIDGTGVNVAIIDWTFDIENKEFIDENGNNKIVLYNDEPIIQEEKNDDGFHGKTVASLLAGNTTGIAPKSKIYYFASNQQWEQEEKTEILDKILDMNNNDGEKIGVVSMSASFSSDTVNKNYTDKLSETECAFISSPNFFKYFSYYNRNPYLDINDSNNFSLQKKTDSMGLTMAKYPHAHKKINTIINDNTKLLTELKNTPNSEEKICSIEKEIEHYKTLLLMDFDELKENINKEMEKNALATTFIPCGGRSYSQMEKGYMYCGHSSASWTIPEVSGLYTLAKQMDPHITYEEFSEMSNSTSYKNDKGYSVINPESLVREINRRNKEKSDSMPDKYENIYLNSNRLISNLDKVIENSKDFRGKLTSGVNHEFVNNSAKDLPTKNFEIEQVNR